MAHNFIIRHYPNKGLMDTRELPLPVGSKRNNRHPPTIPSVEYLNGGSWKPIPQSNAYASPIGPPTLEDLEQAKERGRGQSLSRARTKIEQMMRSNNWDKFIGGTFSKEKVEDRYDYDEMVKCVQAHFRRLKRKHPELEYIVVFETHPSSGAWHWHALLRCVDGLVFVDSGHKDKSGRTIYNWPEWSYGFSTATDVGHSEKAERYLAKYITKKNDVPPGRHRYLASVGIDRTTIQRMFTDSEDREKFYRSHENEFEVSPARETPTRMGTMTYRILRRKQG